jgi:hypothetical protein
MEKAKVCIVTAFLLILLSTVVCYPLQVYAEPREFTPYYELEGILTEIAETSDRVISGLHS